jgi:hypothetical protein
MTRAEAITQIENNVTKAPLTSRDATNTGVDLQVESTGGKIEEHEIPVFITNSDNSIRLDKQKIRVEYDAQGNEVQAWIQSPVYKDYVAESTATSEVLQELTNAVLSTPNAVDWNPTSKYFISSDHQRIPLLKIVDANGATLKYFAGARVEGTVYAKVMDSFE